MSWIFILGLLAIMLAVMSSGRSGTQITSWERFKALIDPDTGRRWEPTPGSPEPVVIKNDRIVATIAPNTAGLNPGKEPAPVWVKIDADSRTHYLAELEALKVDHSADTGQSIWMNLLLTMGPFLLLVLLVLLCVEQFWR